MSTREQTRRIAALIYEMAEEIQRLGGLLPDDPDVTRAMFNIVALERNIRPLMHANDRRSA